MNWLTASLLALMGCWMTVWPHHAAANTFQRLRKFGLEPSPPGAGTRLFYRLQGIGLVSIAAIFAFMSYSE